MYLQAFPAIILLCILGLSATACKPIPPKAKATLKSFSGCKQLTKYLQSQAYDELDRENLHRSHQASLQDLSLNPKAKKAKPQHIPSVKLTPSPFSYNDPNPFGIKRFAFHKQELLVLNESYLLIYEISPTERSQELARYKLPAKTLGFLLIDHKIVLFSQAKKESNIELQQLIKSNKRFSLDSYTLISVLSLKDPSDPILLRELLLEGSFQYAFSQEKKVQFTLYSRFKLSNASNQKRVSQKPQWEQKLTKFLSRDLVKSTISKTTSSSWMPIFQETEYNEMIPYTKEAKSLCKCQQFYRSDEFIGRGVTSFGQIDLDKPREQIGQLAVLGKTKHLYHSQNAVFLSYQSKPTPLPEKPEVHIHKLKYHSSKLTLKYHSSTHFSQQLLLDIPFHVKQESLFALIQQEQSFEKERLQKKASKYSFLRWNEQVLKFTPMTFIKSIEKVTKVKETYIFSDTSEKNSRYLLFPSSIKDIKLKLSIKEEKIKRIIIIEKNYIVLSQSLKKAATGINIRVLNSLGKQLSILKVKAPKDLNGSVFKASSASYIPSHKWLALPFVSSLKLSKGSFKSLTVKTFYFQIEAKFQIRQIGTSDHSDFYSKQNIKERDWFGYPDMQKHLIHDKKLYSFSQMGIKIHALQQPSKELHQFLFP